MSFYQKYALLDPVPGKGTKSFQARQISTGRDVTVHLLEGGETPESEALLARLRNLPPQSMSKVIEVGDHEGTRYVVTVAPPYLHLDEWLAEQERAAPAPDAREFTRAAAWKVPAARPEPPAAPARPAPATHEPGEFTLMLQAAGSPAPAAADKPAQSIPSAGSVKDAVPAKPLGQAGPGEFTSMFQSPTPASTGQMPGPVEAMTPEVRRPAAPPATPPATPPAVPPVAPNVSGEFPWSQSPLAASTGQMPVAAAPQPAPASRPASPPASPPAPPAAASGGEFTGLFQSPLPQAPARDDWPAAQPKSPESGEFTRMFRSPAPNARPAPESTPQQGGEFTRFFKSPQPGTSQGPQLPSASAFPAAAPPPAPSAAPVDRSGEFTRFFGNREPGPEPPYPSPSAPPQTPARPSGGGSATQAFSIPASAPAPPSAPHEPSEYTRMMMAAQPNLGAAPQVPQAGFPQVPGTPQMPGIPQTPRVPQVNFPQAPVMQMPQPVIPQPVIPQPMMPQPPAVPAPGNNLLLIGIFVLLAFLVGGLLVFLLVRH